jgi:pimeloyl-ACP methyl ester carboxylesterase
MYKSAPNWLLMKLQDLRNHGDSAHNPHHDYISMADDVAGFIEEHKLKDTTLIGHSMSVLLQTRIIRELKDC